MRAVVPCGGSPRVKTAGLWPVCLSILLHDERRARVLQPERRGRKSVGGREEWFLSAEANW